MSNLPILAGQGIPILDGYFNPDGSIKLPAAGITPAIAGFTAFGTGGAPNLLNASSGTSVSPVAGTIYRAALWTPFTFTCTGVILTTGTTGGTDKWIGSLWDSAGNLLANSALAGQTAQTNNNKAKFPFASGAITLPGPGIYYIGAQSNGTTAKLLMLPNTLEGFVTDSNTGVFGTLPSLLAPAVTYTINIGPFASTY